MNTYFPSPQLFLAFVFSSRAQKIQEDQRYLDWVRTKHACDSFVGDLVKQCVAEFAVRPDLDDDRRAQIYTRVRQELQRVCDASLRQRAFVHCNP